MSAPPYLLTEYNDGRLISRAGRFSGLTNQLYRFIEYGRGRVALNFSMGLDAPANQPILIGSGTGNAGQLAPTNYPQGLFSIYHFNADDHPGLVEQEFWYRSDFFNPGDFSIVEVYCCKGRG